MSSRRIVARGPKRGKNQVRLGERFLAVSQICLELVRVFPFGLVRYFTDTNFCLANSAYPRTAGGIDNHVYSSLFRQNIS